jgi:NitT/TauT family transport system ATP-binding protein
LATVSVENIGKVWEGRGNERVEALRGISFIITSNEFLCIIGPSGCGKSTLLNIIGGLEKPTEGRVDFSDIKDPTKPLTKMVFQEFALFPWKNVVENITLGLKFRGVARPDREKIAQYLIGVMRLRGFENKYPHELSGGMKQRVAIARALATDPEVILMDEPFGSLDAQTRIVLQDELLRIWEQKRMTVCFVTHNIEEAILLGDRISIMTARPSTLKATIQVELPRPRTAELRMSAAFTNLYKEVWELLKEEVDTALHEAS